MFWLGGGERAYTARDQVETETRYAWVSGAWSNIGTTSYAYDDAQRGTNIKHKDGSGSVLQNTTYTYDTADRLTAQVVDGASTSYSYDNTNQLTQAGTATFAYDANGNRNTNGNVVGTGNRLSTDGVWTYTYAFEGNRCSVRGHCLL